MQGTGEGHQQFRQSSRLADVPKHNYKGLSNKGHQVKRVNMITGQVKACLLPNVHGDAKSKRLSRKEQLFLTINSGRLEKGLDLHHVCKAASRAVRSSAGGGVCWRWYERLSTEQQHQQGA